jgi:hypothetical protein
MDLLQMDFIENCTNKYEECEICIVVSHSCDITNDDKEPFIEILPCHEISKLNKFDFNGRSPRTLNFEVNFNGEEKILQLKAHEKIFVKKTDISVDKRVGYDSCELTLSLFQNWLSSRYKRHAFPNNVNDRIFKKINLRKQIEDKFDDIGKELESIYIETDIEDDGGDYTLHFISDSDYKESSTKIEKFVEDLRKINNSLPPDKDFILFIDHLYDIEISYEKIRKMYYFNLDYFCDYE